MMKSSGASAVLLALTLGMVATSTARAEIVAIANQTTTAGVDGSVTVDTTGFGFFRTWSIRQGTSTGFLCNYTFTSKPSGMTIESSPTDSTQAIISWSAEHTYYNVGTHNCLEVKECTGPLSNRVCDTDVFSWTINKRTSAPSTRRLHDYVYRAGDSETLHIPFRPRNVREPSSGDITAALELVSCPAGAPGCAPPTLPSWVSGSSSTGTPSIAVSPPAGTTAGDWAFRAVPSVEEAEDNDIQNRADRLTSIKPVSASISPATDVDYWIFDADAGDSIVINATPTSGSCTDESFDSYLYLYNSAGVQVDFNNNISALNRCSRMSYSVPSSGNYYVAVTENGRDDTINYELTLSNPGESVFGVEGFTLRIPDESHVLDPRHAQYLMELDAENDSHTSAPVLQQGDVWAGDLGASDEEWWLYLPARPDQPFAFGASDGAGGCPGELELTLYEQQQDGSLLAVALSDPDGPDGCPRLDARSYEEKPDVPYYLRLSESTGGVPVDGWVFKVDTFAHTSTNVGPFAYTHQYGELDVGEAFADSYSVDDGERVEVVVSDGAGGCAGDVRVRVTFSDASYVEQTGSAGSNPCAIIATVSPDDGFATVRVEEVNQDQPLSSFYMAFQTDGAPYDVPSWSGEVSSHSGDSPLTLEYGSCGGSASYPLDDDGDYMTYHAVFDRSGYASDAGCGSYSSTQAVDGLGVCRHMAARLADLPGSGRWSYQLDEHGPVMSMVVEKTDVGDSERFHFVGMQSDRSHDDTPASGSFGSDNPAVAELSYAFGGNDLWFDVPDGCAEQCMPSASGCPNSFSLLAYNRCAFDPVARCTLDDSYLEGERVVIPLRRLNRDSSVALSRCTDTSGSSCGLALLGASYSSSTDTFTWDVPTTAGDASYTFRVRATGAHGEGTSDYYLVVPTAERRLYIGDGPDLYLRSLREEKPMGYQLEDTRRTPRRDRDYGVTLRNNTPVGRSLAEGDAIFVSPMFESGVVGDGDGPATFEAEIYNRGASTGGSTLLKVWLSPQHAAGSTHDADSVLLTTVNVPAIAAGGSVTVEFPVPYYRAIQTAAGGAEAQSMFLEVEHSGSYPETLARRRNNETGPYHFQPAAPPSVFVGIKPITTIPDLHGEISYVSDATPQSGETLTVKARVTGEHMNASYNDVAVRFYLDQVSTPSSGTAYDDEALFDANGSSFTTTVVGQLAVQKPNAADNTLHLRAFIDPTDAVGDSDRVDNHLPSETTTYDVAVQNSAPAFTSSPTLVIDEDVTFEYAAVVADADQVDRSRLTLSALPSLPSGMVWLAPASATASGKTRTLRWTPDEEDAQPGNNSYPITLRSCDGDPVAGGAGACTDHAFTLTVNHVDDAPTFTSTPGTSATENTPYSYAITAFDEEASALSFTLLSGPPGMTLTPAGDGFSAELLWTPSDADYPSQSVSVEIYDDSSRITQVWSIAITNVNDRPTLAAPLSSSASEESAFSTTLALGDVDRDVAGIPQTFSCSLGSAPAWLSVELVSSPTRACRVFGTPGNAHTGAASVTVRASDGVTPTAGTVQRTFTLTVTDTNDAPTLASPADLSATQGVEYKATLAVSDDDIASPGYNESFTYQLLSGPAGMALVSGSNAVQVQWTPSPAQVNPASHAVEVQVTDARGATDSASFTLTVTNVNDAPVLSAPANATRTEGQSYQVQLSASDADADAGLPESLSYSLVGGAPAGLAVSSAGLLSLPSIDDAQVGVWTVTVRATDSHDASDDASFTLTVNNVEEAPSWPALSNQSSAEDAAYSRTVSASDPDAGASVSYSLPVKPAGMSIGASSGVISWTPSNSAVGPHLVTVRATDNTGRSSDVSYTLTVTNTNDAPLVTSSAPTSTSEDAAFRYDFLVSDVDGGDQLTLSAPLLPAWLSFNTATGALTGTPTNDEVGAHDVTLRGTDGAGAFAEQSFSLVVTNVNDAPVLDPVGDRAVAEGGLLSFIVTASDPDGDDVTLSVDPGTLPAGASFDGTTFSWQTTFGDANNYSVTLIADDGALEDQETITITVGNVNRPPVLSAIGDRVVLEDGVLTFTIGASDPDGDSLLLTAVGDAAADPFDAGASFSAATGVFSWQPSYEDAGAWLVTFSVSDGSALDTEEVIISVTDVNRPPLFSATPPEETDEDAAFAYGASATDADGDTLAWSLLEAPPDMSVVASTGALSWAPTQADVGAHDVVVQVNDGKSGGAVTQAFTLSVVNVNDAPLIDSTPGTAASEGVPYSYTLVASDEDVADTITLSAVSLPGWLSFNAGSGVLSGTPGETDGGVSAVELRAADLAGALATQTFSITVAVVNDAPVFVAPTPSGTLSVDENQPLLFSAAAEDPDGPSLSYSATGLPAGASFDSATGAFAWTPGYDDAGARQLTLIVSDGLAQDTRALTIDVVNVDRAPSVSAPAAETAEEGSELSFAISANDPDGDVITLTLESGPPGASFDAASRVFRWTPGYDDAGSASATFRASAGGLFDEATTTISISDTNRAPVIDSAAPLSASEDAPYSYLAGADDPDGDVVSWSLSAGPANATLTSAGALSWTPTGAQVGNRAFTLVAADGRGGSASQSFVVVVSAVNDAPLITSTAAPLALNEDAAWSYQATASDEDGDLLSWTLPVAPAALLVNGSTGALSWTPRNDDVGSHPVTLQVRDPSGATASQSFVLAVANVNDAPVFVAEPAPAATVTEAQTWSWTPATNDVDVGDSVSLTLDEGPAAMTLVSGTLSWTPGNEDVGTHPVTVLATDQSGATAQRSFEITVLNVNDAPYFTSAPLGETIAEGQLLTRTVFAADPDAGDELVYTLIGAPAGLSLDATSGELVFLPDDAEVGQNAFVIRVEDLVGAFAEQSATVTVTAVNDAPVLAAIGDRSVALGAAVTFTLSASDVDGPSATFSMQGAPAAATLSGNSFSWSTSSDDEGVYFVTFTVSDGSLTDSEEVAITVGDGVPPPTLSLPADATVNEGALLQAMITATDPTGAVPTLSASALPSGASFDEETGAFAWTPGYDQAGEYTLVFEASGGGGSRAGNWLVTVRDRNRPPLLVSEPAGSAREALAYASQVVASDPDGDPLSYTLLSGPSGLSLDASGGLSWTPSYAQIGLQTLQVRIDDGRGGSLTPTFYVDVAFLDADDDAMPDSWERAVGTDPAVDDATQDPDADGLINLEEYGGGSDPFVSNAPPAPALVLPLDDGRVDVATPTLVWLPVEDPDGEPVLYEVELSHEDDPSTPVFVADSLVEADGEVAVSVDSALAEGSRYLWRARATDGIGYSPYSASRRFTVDAVNEAPPAPTLVAPPNASAVATPTPTLWVSPVLDPDGDAVSYVFALREGDGLPAFVTSAPVVEDEQGRVRFEVPELLADGTLWFWDVRATDVRGLEGAVAGPFRFTVDLVNLPPAAPTLVSPAQGSIVTANPVTLVLGAVQDPEGAAVSYRVELAPELSFPLASTQTFAGLVAEGAEVSLTTGSLGEGPWYWRAYASDGTSSSAPLEASFLLDAIDDAPPAPALLTPASNSLVPAPVLLVAAGVEDPELGPLLYRFEITDPDGINVLSFVDGVADEDDGAADDVIEASIADVSAGERYGWRVRAEEPDGVVSAWSELRTFRVETSNGRPSAPVLLSPLDEVLEQGDTVAFSLEEAIDPDGDAVLHDVEVYVDGSLLARVDAVAASEGTLDLDVTLSVAGAGSWRARGRDQGGAGPWSEALFTVSPPSSADAGPSEEDAGPIVSDDAGPEPEGDAGALTPGGGDPKAPVVTRVREDPATLPGGCTCGGSSVSDSGLAVALLFALGLLRRRRRRA